MGAAEKIQDFIPLALYWELEEKSDTKHEYLNGQMVAMAGATINHNVLVANIISALNRNTATGNCVVLASDMKVALDKEKHFFYPDVSVVCDEPLFYEERKDTYINPTLIVEVLSDSTEAFDRGKKFNYYRQLSSFNEYVLISQHALLVDVYSRKGENIWKIRSYGEMDDTIVLESLGIEISLSELYKKVSLD
ncbi:MAG: Uma2 family endonuclease [Bacteroidia bacterium]